MQKTKKQLTLNKGSEKYIFRYDEGNEVELLDALVAQANDPRADPHGRCEPRDPFLIHGDAEKEKTIDIKVP